MAQRTDKNAGMDRVVAVSRRADGTPDQTKDFVVLDENGDEHKVNDESEIAADVQRPKTRRASAAAKRADAESGDKETR